MIILKITTVFMMINIVSCNISYLYANQPEDIINQQIDSLYDHINDFFYTNYDSNKIYIERIIQIGERNHLPQRVVEAYSNLANCADYHLKIYEASDYLLKGKNYYDAHRDTMLYLDKKKFYYSSLLYSSGTHFSKTGNIKKGIEDFLQIIKPANRKLLNDDILLFNTYVTLASDYIKLGQFDKAYNNYLLAKQYIPKDENEMLYRTAYESYIGAYFCRTREYNKAKIVYLNIIKTLRDKMDQLAWKSYVITSYNILGGVIYKELNNKDSALLYLNNSLILSTNIVSQWLKETYLYLGKTYFHFNEYESALLYYFKCQSLVMSNNNKEIYYNVQLLKSIAEVYYQMQDHTKALQYINEAISVQTDSANISGTDSYSNPPFNEKFAGKNIVELLTLKANILYNWYNADTANTELLQHAIETYKLASDYLDLLRFSIETNEIKEFVAQNGRQLYENALRAVTRLIALDPSKENMEDAYYFLEKSKNRILYEAVRNANIQHFYTVPENVLKRETELKATISYLNEQLLKKQGATKNISEYSSLEVELASARQQYAFFLDSLKVKYPKYHALQYNTKIVSLDDVQKNLVPNHSVLLEYFMGDSSITVLGISRSKRTFHSIAASNPEFSAVYRELDSIRNIVSGNHIYDEEYSPEQYRTFIHSGYNLYNQLVGPVLDQLDENIRDLIIIPDGQLGYLPFELLISKLPEDTGQVDYKNLDYLVKKYVVRYDYSTSLLNENLKLAQLPVNSYDNEYTGFAPDYSVSAVPDSNKTNDVYKAGSIGILDLLKYNKEEITQAAKLFHGIVFSGNKASESNFKSDTIRSRILHLAAHAILNNQHPEFSGITFSDYGRGESKDKDDGILYAHEIYNLNLNSDLVLLSACETGLGKIARGEGIISLARAFKYAGCRNIVMSLWKANDKTTSEIIYDFCKNLKKGMPKDEALQKAKLKYLETSDHPHPFYWATFVLIGDNLPVEKHLFSPKIILSVLFSILLLSFILFHVRKKFVKK